VHTDERRQRLDLDLDLRAFELWRYLIEIEVKDDDLAAIGRLVREAYGAGYRDALVEERRGQLYRDHGWPVPARRGC